MRAQEESWCCLLLHSSTQHHISITWSDAMSLLPQLVALLYGKILLLTTTLYYCCCMENMVVERRKLRTTRCRSLHSLCVCFQIMRRSSLLEIASTSASGEIGTSAYLSFVKLFQLEKVSAFFFMHDEGFQEDGTAAITCPLLHTADSTPNSNKGAALTLFSWNVWGVPVDSDRTLSRSLECGAFIRDIADLDNPGASSVVVACFQEAWGWKCGVLLPFLHLARYFESLGSIGRVVSIIVQVLSILCGWVIPFVRWDHTKTTLSNSLQHRLRFAYGMGGMSLSYRAAIDSGLMILSNIEATTCGFQAFSVKAKIDTLANKGLLWVYFEEISTLVITTHLQGGRPHIKKQQMLELREFVESHAGMAEHVYVTGDFNINTLAAVTEDSPDLETYLYMSKISDNCITCPRYKDGCLQRGQGKCIDHIFRRRVGSTNVDKRGLNSRRSSGSGGGDILPTKTRVYETTASDHFLVRVDVGILGS